MPDSEVRGQESRVRGVAERYLCYLLPTTYYLLIKAAPAWGGPAGGEESGAPLVLLLLAMISFPALALVLWALAPAPLIAICKAIARGRGRCLVMGLLAAAVGLSLTSVLGQYKGAGEIIAALILGLLALSGLTGLTAVTGLLGKGVLEQAGRSGSRALAVGVGAVLMVVAGLFPIVGQVLLVYFVLVGTGGALHALVRSGRQEK
jgi:hypothetical protein